jgi:hypothetical protein
VRQLQGDRTPSVREILALADAPSVWRVGRDHVLVGYPVTYPADWPAVWGGTPTAWQVLDRHGEVVGQWAQRGELTFAPAGRHFVGLQPRPGFRVTQAYGDARNAVLVRHGRPAPLRLVPGERAKRPGDVRTDGGWLVDPARRTITRETLPLCLRGSSRLDEDGRIWCLNGRKDRVLWSGGGAGWRWHGLSTSYFEWCDGGSTGADLQILGDTVTIGLLRADFSADHGGTWWDVDLPVEMVGAGVPRGYSEQNCAQVAPLADNRLVLHYFGAVVARDASNTEFRKIRTPRNHEFTSVQEGVMTAATREPYGDLLGSFDGGATWRPIRAPDLARTLLARRG